MSRPDGRIRALDELARKLCSAPDVDALASMVLDFTARDLQRCLLFKIKGGGASIWEWRGFETEREAALRLQFPLTSEPLFQLLAGQDCYRGPVPDDPGHRRLYQGLGVPAPREILLLPLRIEDRIVALFYGDGGEGALTVDTGFYQRIVRKLALALNMLVLRQKIHAA